MLFTSVIINWGEITSSLFNHPIKGNKDWQIISTALGRSFLISGTATLIDLGIGLPMAFILTRYNFKGKKLLDTLVALTDSPHR